MQYEEPYTPRPRRTRPRPRPRRRSFGAWLAGLLLRLIALALGLALLAAGALYALPPALFAVEPEGADLSLTDGLPESRANVLLLGLDERREGAQRSDSIIIASVGYGSVKLASVLRDMELDIPGYGPGKLNSAYAHGGAQLTMKTLNQSLGMNLMHYVAVDYRALADIVDALGGVELSISEAEMDKINLDIDADRERYAAYGYTAPILTQSGDGTHLNGLQALTYARIRKLDSDFGRTGRQRKLLEAMLKKLRARLWDPAMLVRLAKTLAASLQTDLSPVQLVSLGEKALAAGVPEQLRLPVEGAYDDDGATLRVTDLAMNAYSLKKFLYGE